MLAQVGIIRRLLKICALGTDMGRCNPYFMPTTETCKGARATLSQRKQELLICCHQDTGIVQNAMAAKPRDNLQSSACEHGRVSTETTRLGPLSC